MGEHGPGVELFIRVAEELGSHLSGDSKGGGEKIHWYTQEGDVKCLTTSHGMKKKTARIPGEWKLKACTQEEVMEQE
ncbi:hypothetical protein ACP70R_007408 [Stipagrostis hirtigluma subsp. patula]